VESAAAKKSSVSSDEAPSLKSIISRIVDQRLVPDPLRTSGSFPSQPPAPVIEEAERVASFESFEKSNELGQQMDEMAALLDAAAAKLKDELVHSPPPPPPSPRSTREQLLTLEDHYPLLGMGRPTPAEREAQLQELARRDAEIRASSGSSAPSLYHAGGGVAPSQASAEELVKDLAAARPSSYYAIELPSQPARALERPGEPPHRPGVDADWETGAPVANSGGWGDDDVAAGDSSWTVQPSGNRPAFDYDFGSEHIPIGGLGPNQHIGPAPVPPSALSRNAMPSLASALAGAPQPQSTQRSLVPMVVTALIVTALVVTWWVMEL
jgi:hypothetical protein